MDTASGSRSNSHLRNTSTMPIRGQQNQPMPSVTEADNFNKSIVHKRCSELLLHICHNKLVN